MTAPETAAPARSATAALNEARRVNVPRGISTSVAGAYAESAKGSVVRDLDGNDWIDFAGGIGVLNVGHRPDAVVAALHRQVDRFLHTCFSVMAYEGYIKVAERLNSITPGAFPKKTVLFNSGAEGVENAAKIARYATGRPLFVSFGNSFHGRTNLTLGLSGKEKPYREGFAPFPEYIRKATYPYPYRGVSDDDALISFETLMAEIGGQVAAVFLEPIQGEGGFVVPGAPFVSGVARITRSHGALLVADEIQTGFGRTGRMFAIEHFGVVPDMIITAKSLAAGMPLSAVTGRAEIMDAPHPGGLGGTYGGNPLACAAAIAVMDLFERDDLVTAGLRVGEILKTRLSELALHYPVIGEVRGMGPMQAIELVRDRETREPDPALTKAVLAACHRRGLIVITAGGFDNVLRFLAPLNTPTELVHEAMDRLDASLSEVLALTPEHAHDAPSDVGVR